MGPAAIEGAWDNVIPVDTQFREASRSGQPLTLVQPQSRGSEAYFRLLDTLLEIAPPQLLQRAG